jgi:hypothetical protein
VGDSLLFERQGIDPVTLALFGYIDERRFGQRKAAQLVLDQYLPERDGTEPHVVVRGTDGLGHVVRKFGVSG